MLTTKNVRAVLIWTVVLAMGGVIAAGYAVTELASHSDHWIEQALRSKLAEIAPDWEVDFESLTFDVRGELQLKNVRVRPHSGPENIDLLQVPMLELELDGELLRNDQRVIVRHVLLHQPQAVLFRDASGRWNWQAGRIPPSTSGVSPPWEVEDGRALIGVQQLTDGPVQELTVEHASGTFRPEAFRRYAGKAQVQLAGMSPADVNILFDAQSGEWRVNGATRSLQVNDALLSSVARLIPDGEAKLASLGIGRPRTGGPNGVNGSPLNRWASNAMERGGNVPVEMASAAANTASALRADAKLQFHVGQARKGEPFDYAVTASIDRGQLSDAVLPIPLFDLSTDIELTPDRLVIRELSAANGESRLFVDGELVRGEAGWGKEFVVRATQLRLDRRVRQFLTPGLLKLYDLLQPAGVFDLDVGVIDDGVARPQVTLRKFTAIDCSAIHAMFPYPVQGVTGDIQQQGEVFHINMQGLAGDRPVTLSGIAVPDGVRTQLDLTVHGTGIPVDDRLHTALNTPKLSGALKAIEALDLHGRGDGTARFTKRGELDPTIQIQLDIQLRDGTVN
ncbi:MAG: hypothetical protein KDA58_09760, partial [Planctomycetaceae bacterium]|nr:hypothetical protein [Planctomycetaceae bacterium]